LALGHAAVVVAALAWAAGSIYGRSAPLPRDVRQSTALQLLAGAAWLAAASGVSGEWRGFSFTQITPASLAALGYLVVFGSVIAFTAYIWLLQTTTASRVAVALGAAVGGEPVTLVTLVSALTIIAGVVLVLVDQSQPAAAVDSVAAAAPSKRRATYA